LLMKKSMLEYTKTILTKVSFNKTLFFKEYKKARLYLQPQEVNALRDWLRKNKFPFRTNFKKIMD
jgi:hypothetical protein